MQPIPLYQLPYEVKILYMRVGTHFDCTALLLYFSGRWKKKKQEHKANRGPKKWKLT